MHFSVVRYDFVVFAVDQLQSIFFDYNDLFVITMCMNVTILLNKQVNSKPYILW